MTPALSADESTSEEDAAGIGADRDAFIAMVREFFTTGGDEMTALASAGAGRARLIHGDPFLDNLMVNGAGEAAAAARNFAGLEPEDIAKAAGSGEDESNLDVTLIDFEDTCVGPPVYDLAQAAIGGCFGWFLPVFVLPLRSVCSPPGPQFLPPSTA